MATRDAVSDLIRGNIDAIILCSLSGGDNYGYEILKGIAQASRGEYEMKEPSLYTSLKRLESQGFVESYWGSETQGARRKYYRITSAGVQELGEATERWIQVRKIIDRLLNQEGRICESDGLEGGSRGTIPPREAGQTIARPALVAGVRKVRAP